MKKNIYTFFMTAIFAVILFTRCSSSSVDQQPPPGPTPQDTTQTDNTQALSDTALMDTVQRATFRYFWDYAEPTSGMARERSNGSATTVTAGGTGFGLASFPAAIERGWISRGVAIQRLKKILNFLENVPTYHGAFSHWYNGSTGKTQPFSQYDNGGDLVETTFLLEGLLINRQYFDQNTSDEQDIRDRITTIWRNVDWNWYTQGQNVLYWHWSPDYGFKIGLKIAGYNEALLSYILAAASPTNAIKPAVYDQGWAQNGEIKNGNTYYNKMLPLGPAKGGPLFFAHYSFIGLNPNGLSDKYADYDQQVKAHTLINYSYCVENPLGYRGYRKNAWGLTASDDPNGYAAHSPTHDTGVITPTAALSSIPYTPEKSLAAMHYFYEQLSDRIWGEYGFHDAYSLQKDWVADSYLANDEGPIIAMIENYRSGLLWNLFMRDPDVKKGLQRLGFTSPNI